MKEVMIRLSSPQRVQKFVGSLIPLDGDFELVAKNFILDARSFMGIFTFDLTRPIRLRIHNDNEKNMAAIAPYLVDMEETNVDNADDWETEKHRVDSPRRKEERPAGVVRNE
jgi:phosphocarrier protein HPr